MLKIARTALLVSAFAAALSPVVLLEGTASADLTGFARLSGIDAAYREAFGRGPSQGETSYWNTQRNDWKTTVDLVNLHRGYLKSNDAERRAMIKLSYKFGMDRDATAAEVDWWSGEVARNGYTYRELIAKHKEFRAKQQPAPPPPATPPPPPVAPAPPPVAPGPGPGPVQCNSSKSRAGISVQCASNVVTDATGCLSSCVLGAGVYNLNTKRLGIRCDGNKPIAFWGDGSVLSCFSEPSAQLNTTGSGGRPIACAGGTRIAYDSEGYVSSCMSPAEKACRERKPAPFPFGWNASTQQCEALAPK